MRCIGIVYLTATICSAFHVAPPLRTFTKPHGVMPLEAAPGRVSSSFMVPLVARTKPSLVKIDLFGPRGAQTGTGTGIVLPPLCAGLIATNAHVASASRECTLTLSDGTLIPAELVGRSAECDVAVLKADPSKWASVTEASKTGSTSSGSGDLGAAVVAAAELGSSADLEVGEYALAVGYGGSGAEFSASLGVVSALGKRRAVGMPNLRRQTPAAKGGTKPAEAAVENVKEKTKEAVEDATTTTERKDVNGRDAAASVDSDLIPVVLTDAALSFGNSGGPLLNEWGEVIGMNTMIEMRPSSIGVAIAVEKVREVVDAILNAREAADQSAELKLFLYNDRMNSRAVVQAALAKVFGWDEAKSNEVMLVAHTQGRALCGTWPANEASAFKDALSAADLLVEVEATA